MSIMLYRKTGNKIIKSENLSDIFENWKADKEKWLFISPHDDDIIIGSGILLQKAFEEKINVEILIFINYNSIIIIIYT